VSCEMCFTIIFWPVLADPNLACHRLSYLSSKVSLTSNKCSWCFLKQMIHTVPKRMVSRVTSGLGVPGLINMVCAVLLVDLL